jgi:hypothetical protein
LRVATRRVPRSSPRPDADICGGLGLRRRG